MYFNLLNGIQKEICSCREYVLTEGFTEEIGDGVSTNDCLIVTARAKYVGENAPIIQFLLVVKNEKGEEESILFESHEYTLGKEQEYTGQQWRVPPAFLNKIYTRILVRIPEGTQLFLQALHADRSNAVTEWNGQARFDAHLGFNGLAPGNTLPAMELAAQSGFPACIVVPKVTADGKLVCIHDDTINATARDEQGNPPAEPMYVWDMTYTELLQWDFGRVKNDIYKGTRIPLVEDFFALCARTGMRPMFSTHPNLSKDKWQEVKDMLRRYGLLKKFLVKSFSWTTLRDAYAVLGKDVEGYIYDTHAVPDRDMIAQLLEIIPVDPSIRVGIECDSDHWSKEMIEEAHAAGLFASAWCLGRREKFKDVIAMGVVEFSEDYHCSTGLNW